MMSERNVSEVRLRDLGFEPTFSGVHMRQSLRLSCKYGDHFFNSSLKHTSQTFPSVNIIISSDRSAITTFIMKEQ